LMQVRFLSGLQKATICVRLSTFLFSVASMGAVMVLGERE